MSTVETCGLLELCVKHTNNSSHASRLCNNLKRGIFDWTDFKSIYSIKTVDDLRNASLEDIARIPGLGSKSMEVVRKMKEDIGGAQT